MRKPSQKNESQSYRRLSKAALALFSQRDLNSVTIKDIAESAGLNTALIYYYFESKQHLFESCIEDAIAGSLETYEKLKAQHVADPVNLIEDWFVANLKTAGSLRKLLKIIVYSAESETRFRSIEKLPRKFYRIETEILASSIEQGIAQGIFKNVDARDIATFISVHLDGLIIGSLVRPKFKTRKEMDGLRDKLMEFLGYQK